MPSTVSSVVSRPRASSTVMTPSFPTFSIASAIRLPISASLLAEMVPTCAISFFPLVGTLIFFNSSTTVATALSMPRLIAIGLPPAVTFLRPSRKMACASTVAVVVPSPAMSEVFEATSRTICAPMFSSGSLSSISLATVTPSLVIVGDPNFFSMTTLRPLGPRVTLTASASRLTPASRARRDSSPYAMCLAICSSPDLELLFAFSLCFRAFGGSFNHAKDVVLAHNQVLFVIELDFGSGVLTKQHSVTLFDVQRDAITTVEFLSGSGCYNLALLRFLFCAVRNDDAPTALFAFVDPLDDHAILKRAYTCHFVRCSFPMNCR